MFSHPSQMEPLTIEPSRPAYGEMMGLASDLLVASARLESKLPLPTARGIADLMTGMNCYYSNLIEGHHTLPAEIERAMQTQPATAKERDLRSLAHAHVITDRESRFMDSIAETPMSISEKLHQKFMSLLPSEMLILETGAVVTPGAFRQTDENVTVGQHVPPGGVSLPQFIDRFNVEYQGKLHRAAGGGHARLEAIVGCFAAHHRFAWIHPFMDGNGRVGRILLDCMLRAAGVNPAGLWSMSRGFAKAADEYKKTLALADLPRQGDLDGRGNLSEKWLVAFCRFAMTTAIDQANFVLSLLDSDRLKRGVQMYFATAGASYKQQAGHLYMNAIAFGEFERGEAARITGLNERSAREILSRLVADKFLLSDTPKGPVRAGFPSVAVGYFLPNLYPAGSLDPADPPALSVTTRTRKKG